MDTGSVNDDRCHPSNLTINDVIDSLNRFVLSFTRPFRKDMSDERLAALLNDLLSDDEETLSQVLASQVPLRSS